MKKRFLIVFGILLLIPLVYAGLEGQCTIRQSCNQGETAILSASGPKNAHISKNISLNDYNVCCPGTQLATNCTDRFDFIFNANTSFSTDILRLSRPFNAQVQITNFSSNIPYPEEACLSASSIIKCGYFQNQCPQDKKCVLRVSGETNAHVESCENTNYNNLLCCNTYFFKADLEGTIGYCPRQNQCLKRVIGSTNANNPESYECVESGDFTKDSFCENGNWTSRTKFVALQLLSLPAAGNYILFCDSADNALNYAKYLVGQETAENYIAGKANNFCVISYENKIVFGTSLNQGINDANLPFLSLLGISSCNEANDNNYNPCDNSKKAWYNKNLKTVIYSKDAIDLRPLNFFESFVNFLKSPFTTIANLIKGKVSEPPFDNSYISSLKKFDKLYLNRAGNKAIRGTMEGLQFKNMLIEYQSFDTDICSFVDKFGQTTSDAGSGIVCRKDGNNYYVLAQGSTFTTLNPNIIWTDLTSSLRIR